VVVAFQLLPRANQGVSSETRLDKLSANKGMDQNSAAPVLLIVRDPEEWRSNEFVILFREEGYETRDVNAELLPIAVNELKPFGVIGNNFSRRNLR